MAYETKPNTGSLFRNDKKEADTHPDYKGSGLINGVDHWLDAWINTSTAGVKYMSLKFKPKDAQRSSPGADVTYGSGNRQPAASDLDDDVPF